MAEGASSEVKKPMSDQERLELCEKMDKELDDFINGLEKKRYTEGWPEDRWEEEMDKHPFFMKSNPDGNDMSPLAEGLAKLKYDPEENTPVELANNYKEDGNFNFKHQNYRLAIMGYTEGIKQKCNDAKLNASLYNNRAAAHWHLKNYRSSLIDSERALSFDPDHTKARYRAAKSALLISKFDTCIEHCGKLNADDNSVPSLIAEAKMKKLMHERTDRKRMFLESKKQEQNIAVIKAIKERGIQISNVKDEDDLDLSKLEPKLPGAERDIVFILNGVIYWPVLCFYPEYEVTDFIKTCDENVPLVTQLEQLFPASWDYHKKYSVAEVNVYFEGTDNMPHKVNCNMKLGDLLKSKYFILRGGMPTFIVVHRGSQCEKTYLDSF